jgi:hypothetical protein
MDCSRNWNLDASSSATTRSARPVMWNGRDIFDPTDPKSSSSQHSNRGLRTWARSSRTMPTGCPYSNVKSCDSPILCSSSSGSSRLHRRVGRTLKSVRLHVLSTGTSRDSLRSSEVGYVHQSVVERGVYVCDAPALNTLLRNRCFLLLVTTSRSVRSDTVYYSFVEPPRDTLHGASSNWPAQSLHKKHYFHLSA